MTVDHEASCHALPKPHGLNKGRMRLNPIRSINLHVSISPTQLSNEFFRNSSTSQIKEINHQLVSWHKKNHGTASFIRKIIFPARCNRLSTDPLRWKTRPPLTIGPWTRPLPPPPITEVDQHHQVVRRAAERRDAGDPMTGVNIGNAHKYGLGF
jgi:hypothetical protein